jgi:ribosome-associated protein
VIKAQASRSLEQNKAQALQRLSDLVARAALVPERRRPTKPTFGSRQRRLRAKGVRSEVKLLRSRVLD